MKCSYCSVIIRNRESISYCEYCGAKLKVENKIDSELLANDYHNENQFPS